MKPRIIVEGRPRFGVPLHEVPFGTIVQRAFNSDFNSDGECFYQVVSTSDGTGNRYLVTIVEGTPKRVPQELMVVPVRATVVIHGTEDAPLTRLEESYG